MCAQKKTQKEGEEKDRRKIKQSGYTIEEDYIIPQESEFTSLYGGQWLIKDMSGTGDCGFNCIVEIIFITTRTRRSIQRDVGINDFIINC